MDESVLSLLLQHGQSDFQTAGAAGNETALDPQAEHQELMEVHEDLCEGSHLVMMCFCWLIWIKFMD